MDTIKYYCTDAWFEGTELYYEKFKDLNKYKGGTYTDLNTAGFSYMPEAYPYAYEARAPHDYSEKYYYNNVCSDVVPFGNQPNCYGVLGFPRFNVDKGYVIRSAHLYLRLSDKFGSGGLITTSDNVSVNGFKVSNLSGHSLSNAEKILASGEASPKFEVLENNWRRIDVTNILSNSVSIANALVLFCQKPIKKYVLDSGSWRLCHPNVAYNPYHWEYTNFRTINWEDYDKRPNTPMISVLQADTPYLKVDWIPTPPDKPSSLSPDNQIVNPRTDIRLAWNSTEYQTRFKINYRVNGGAWTTVDRKSQQRYFIIPAGSIKESTGTFEWNVQVWGADSDAVSQIGTAICELGVLPQRPPILLRPVEDYVKSGREIEFEWAFIANSIETQKSFELQFRLAGDTWNTHTGTGEANTFSINTAHSGSAIAEWRMRVTNNYDEVSEWTEIAHFTLVGIPASPQILEITSEGRPLIKWATPEQESYRITVWREDEKVYDSGNIINEQAREHRVAVDLYPEQYLFRLSVRNAFGLGSPIAELLSSVSDPSIKAPLIKAFDGQFYTTIKSAEGAEVYRDGVYAGIIKNGYFHDYGAINRVNHTYTVKVRENFNFAESNKQIAACKFYGDTLAPASDPSKMISLFYSVEQSEKRDETVTIENEKLLLEGREMPFYEYGEHEDHTLTRSYFVFPEALDSLKKMLRNRTELLYRDRTGWNANVSLSQISSQDFISAYGQTIALTLTRVGKEQSG